MAMHCLGSFFNSEFFTKNNRLSHPHCLTSLTWPPATFLFPQLKIKLEGSHFDTNEVTEAESQAVLNTLTEQDFLDTFKKWQKHWEWCTQGEENYFTGDGGQ
jgi:hypothetical protein